MLMWFLLDVCEKKTDSICESSIVYVQYNNRLDYNNVDTGYHPNHTAEIGCT